MLTRQFACAIVLTVFSTNAHAQSSSPSNIAKEFVLGEAQGLRVVAWIKEEATLADDDWFRLEINNSGPDLIVRGARIVAPGEYGGNKVDNLMGSFPLDIPAHGQVEPYETFVLPAGRFITSLPGRVIATWLNPRYYGLTVAMRLSFRADKANAAPLILSNPNLITFRWPKPTAEQLEVLKRQTSALLQRVFALAPDQVVKLRALLGMDEIRDSVAIDEVLAAASQRQTAQKFEHHELVAVMFRRWPNEPKVVEFFKEGLRERGRGTGAILDLASSGQPPWDDSLLEPIVSLVERTSLEESQNRSKQGNPIYAALEYLDRTHARWSNNPTIAPRLSAAVLRVDPTPAPDAMYFWSRLLGMTHDRSMIKILRPYLTDGTIDSPTLMGAQYPPNPTPMRFSELAANAICHLLGEPMMFSPWDRPRAPKGGPYPEWAAWDKKLAALRQRLDAMGR